MASSIIDWLRSSVAHLLQTTPDRINPDERFRDLGLDSRQALDLSAALSTHLEQPVSPTIIWQHPTIRTLAERLAGNATTVPSAMVAPLKGRPADEPIAIVGMACRLPGGIDSVPSLWTALQEGMDGIREVPADRWDAHAWLDEDVLAPGKMTTRWGGFLNDVAGFDAPFFRISPKEAAQMDPQQRIALETSWEALENAGLVATALAGSQTGVFVGAWSHDYEYLVGVDPENVQQHSAVGWNTSIIPARIAYTLGLQGPVMTVNTACSSSLVAVHLAAHSLRRGESTLALVGGVNLLLAPHMTVQMTKFGGMNPAGQCRAFDAGAAGYVRAEGCCVVVMRRLSDAVAAGDRIYAVLVGSAVNNDGASNGLSAPNPDAQAQVLRSAWQGVDVPLADVSYVEAHGTGTILGDPIEASALGRVFQKDRTDPLRIGTIKSNLGHLEGAAGIAGLMKTALALHHGQLPKNLHFDAPNPHIPFDELALRVVDERQCWPDRRIRYAGISSFGYGGTNAHVALREVPPRSTLIPLRATDHADLRTRAETIATEIERADSDSMLRQWMAPQGDGPLRAIVGGRHPTALARALRALGRKEGDIDVSKVPSTPLRIAFVFQGQGGQWLGMGRDLLASEPTFRRTVGQCSARVKQLTGWSIIDELYADAQDAPRQHSGGPALDLRHPARPRTLAAELGHPTRRRGRTEYRGGRSRSRLGRAVGRRGDSADYGLVGSGSGDAVWQRRNGRRRPLSRGGRRTIGSGR
jgi:acyl transferase domain-containing protein/acyl carrier protein